MSLGLGLNLILHHVITDHKWLYESLAVSK